MHRSASPILACAAGVLLLAGCATGPRAPAPRINPIENQLMAEIALERGQYLVAAQQYLNVALQSPDPGYARRATELAYDYGFDAYGLAAARRWVALEPESGVAHAYLGRLQVARNDLDAAWEALQVALGWPSDRSPQDYALLAEDLSGAGFPGRARRLFDRFNDTWPEDPGVTRALAELAAQTGDLDTAIEMARETVALRPDWYATRIWLSRLLLLDGQPSVAFEQMAFALEMNPGLELELEFVQLLSLAGEAEAAFDRLARVSERFPNEPAVRLIEASLHRAVGDLASAASIYLEFLTEGSYVNESRWQLGSIAYERGDLAAAADFFSTVRGERLRAARFALSQIYVDQGNTDAALRELRNYAVDFPKKAFLALQPQAVILADAGRIPEAVQTMELALEYRPWDENLWLYKGALFEQAGQLDEALEAFARAVEIAPDNAEALNAYGYTLTLATRRYSEASEYIEAAHAADPDNPAIMDSLGWVLFKQGRIEEARGWLERAYALLDDPEIAAHLGELYWAADDRDAARRVWESARQAWPDSRALRETVERFLGR